MSQIEENPNGKEHEMDARVTRNGDQDSEVDRSFNRVSVDINGRFMREDRSEFACRVDNMSPGDVAIVTSIIPPLEEMIIAYLEHIGRIEGCVTRQLDSGFVMSYRGSERRRERIAAQLTWITNRHELDLPEDRRHERIEPETSRIDLKLDDGRKYAVTIIDLSISGAAVRSSVRPVRGARVTLGNTLGRVVRHIDDGFAIEFTHERGGSIRSSSDLLQSS